jgi:hypothetical protein
MEKVTVKKLIEFRGKNEQTRITFVNNLKKKKLDDGSGGDYWISCLSAIRNAFRLGEEDLLDEKIDLLYEKIKVTEIKRIKDQFQRNIDVLHNFKEYDFQHLKPNADLTFLRQPKNKSLLDINGLPIEAKPCHIYTFSEDNSEEIGGIWFIAKLGGFEKSELGMFADILYRYLDKYYSKKFYVNSNYCIAVDLFNGQEINYLDIKNGNIPMLIDTTIAEMKKI